MNEKVCAYHFVDVFNSEMLENLASREETRSSYYSPNYDRN